MAEVHSTISGQALRQNINIYVNANTDPYSTDLLFPAGVPVNGIVSLFVGDFTSSHSEECCHQRPDLCLATKQRLVITTRRFRNLPMCVPVPCSENRGVEAIWKDADPADDRVTVSAKHLTLVDERDEPPSPSPDIDLPASPIPYSPAPSAKDDDDACSIKSAADVQNSSRLSDTSAPAFDFFSTSEESEDDDSDICLSDQEADAAGGTGKVRRFVCGLCEKTFPGRAQCRRHVWSHLPTLQTSYKCAICSRIFTQQQSLIRHIATLHNNKNVLTCDVCSAQFTSKHALEKHARLHTHRIHVYVCEYCMKVFSSKTYYANHIERQHKNEEIEGCSTSVPENKNADPVECGHCGAFRSASELLFSRHLKSAHPGAESYKCNMCSLVFQNIAQRERHEQMMHVIELDREPRRTLHKCRLCDRRITTLQGFAVHLRCHFFPKEKPFLCSTCGMQLSSRCSLRTHATTHKPRTALKCPHCPRVVYSKIYLRKHITQFHMAGLNFVCRHCGKKFKTSSELKMHLAILHLDSLDEEERRCVSNLKKHRCELCPFATYNRRIFCSHMNLHPEAGWFRCDRCVLSYARYEDLAKHRQRSHRRVTCKRRCPDCPRVFFSNFSYEEHAALHAAGEGTACTVCGRVFATPAQMERHAERHDVANHQTCLECGKTFGSLQSLHVHQRSVHEGRMRPRGLGTPRSEQLHHCDVCGHMFKLASSLEAHRVCKHRNGGGDPRSLSCPLCDKHFSSEATLAMHLRIHFNEKPYQCRYCGMEFAQHGAAKSHEERHKRARNFRCPHCSQQFLFQNKLNVHLRSAHAAELALAQEESQSSGDTGEHGEVEEEVATTQAIDSLMALQVPDSLVQGVYVVQS
ncbi:unnamed protein product [Ixodes persulcatus]